MDACSVYLEVVLILMQDRCMVCAKRTIRLRNCFGRTRWNSKVMWDMWNLASFHLETVFVSMQDMCTVCAKRTIRSKKILTHPMVLLGDEAQVEGWFGPF
jgi:hypothetical protein